MVGRKVKHRDTGEIREIEYYSSSGIVKFTDGSSGDIHWRDVPHVTKGKNWVLIPEADCQVLITESYQIY